MSTVVSGRAERVGVITDDNVHVSLAVTGFCRIGAVREAGRVLGLSKWGMRRGQATSVWGASRGAIFGAPCKRSICALLCLDQGNLSDE